MYLKVSGFGCSTCEFASGPYSLVILETSKDDASFLSTFLSCSKIGYTFRCSAFASDYTSSFVRTMWYLFNTLSNSAYKDH